MNCKEERGKVELKLRLSPPRDDRRRQIMSGNESMSSTEVSPRSSCVSRETSPVEEAMRYSDRDSDSDSDSMMLVGCPRCLMYVMLLHHHPQCPKCKSTVLLDFLHQDANTSQLKK